MAIVTERKTVVYEVDWKELARLVEIQVMGHLHKALEDWAQDVSMRAMHLADAADGLRVVELLAAGNWTKAEQKLRDMDTAARDWVYEWIEQSAGAGFVELARKNQLTSL